MDWSPAVTAIRTCANAERVTGSSLRMRLISYLKHFQKLFVPFTTFSHFQSLLGKAAALRSSPLRNTVFASQPHPPTWRCPRKKKEVTFTCCPYPQRTGPCYFFLYVVFIPGLVIAAILSVLLFTHRGSTGVGIGHQFDAILGHPSHRREPAFESSRGVDLNVA